MLHEKMPTNEHRLLINYVCAKFFAFDELLLRYIFMIKSNLEAFSASLIERLLSIDCGK